MTRTGLLAMAVFIGATSARCSTILEIDFEGLPSGTLYTIQTPGLVFSDAKILTAGISLNEIDFPPHSGASVVTDNGGPISITGPLMESFGAYFTYSEPLIVHGFNASNVLVASATSLFGANYTTSGTPGATPNEFINITSASGFSRVVITGAASGFSFAMDDATIQDAVPEPGTLIFSLCGVLLLLLARRRNVVREVGIVALLAAPSLWCQTFSTARITLPAVSPMMATAGSVDVTVSVSISPGTLTLLPAVNLLEVDSSGNPLRILGSLHDDGLGGDAVAGDFIFTGQFQLSHSSPGLVGLQASAPFQGMVQRMVSEVYSFEFLPQGAPTTVATSDLTCTLKDLSGGNEYVGNQVLAQVPPGTPYSRIQAIASSINGAIIGVVPGMRMNTWQIEVGCQTSYTSLAAAAGSIDVPGKAWGAELNAIVDETGYTPNDPKWSDPAQYSMRIIQADRAWTITRGAIGENGPTVAVIDSGLNFTHPEFTGRTALAKDYICDFQICDGKDYDGHGTKVAGIIGAAGDNNIGVAGVCWKCMLLIYKTQKSNGKGDAATISAAILEAAGKSATVINLSLGAAVRSETECKAIADAQKKGTISVAGAGNNGNDTKFYPAGFQGFETFGSWFKSTYFCRPISVGSTDDADAKAATSNYGSWVDLYAPGVNVGTTTRLGGYTTCSGTSCAAPHVSGVVALLRAVAPKSSSGEIGGILITIMDATTNNDPNGKRIFRLNAFKPVFYFAATENGEGAVFSDIVGASAVKGIPITMGNTRRGRTDTQPADVHGVSVPLLPTRTTYEVEVSYSLSTFDAYVNQEYYDAFSLTSSAKPYWQLSLNPNTALNMAVPANPVSIGFLWGGTMRGPQAAATQTSNGAKLTVSGGTNTILNVVLDTKTFAKADTSFPSAGSFTITDITPK